ncbi:hypothetical protein NVS55_18265 [Myxococcus stipitatus]|uniref:hypothetical protein n=1 Tax=Myxococcus stipitatus TaxID=83455 RepID=UPI003144DD0A
MKRQPWLLVILCFAGPILGCASNANLRVVRLADGRLRVEGPMAGPFKTSEELAANACTLMTSQGGASAGPSGSEYCAVHYYSAIEDAYFLSYLSDVKSRLDTRQEKTCEMPRALFDPTRPDAVIIGGDHTHPHNRQFSPGDLRGQWRPLRIFDKKSGRIFQRELFVFFRERDDTCRAYRYNYVTRLVSALREMKWIPIGQAYGDHGSIEMFEGMGWLP